MRLSSRCGFERISPDGFTGGAITDFDIEDAPIGIAWPGSGLNDHVSHRVLAYWAGSQTRVPFPRTWNWNVGIGPLDHTLPRIRPSFQAS